MKKALSLILFVTVWLFATFSFVATPAYAGVKCGDAPTSSSPGGLTATWAGPAPERAKISLTDGSIFSTVNKVTGSEIPKDFPEEYTKNLDTAAVFDLVQMDKGSSGIFKENSKTERVRFAALVEHPKVANSADLTGCSIVLQRGAIIYDQGTSVPTETLFLRSYFHSETSSGNFVNFVPRTVIRMSFPSETVWFPVEPNPVVREPASYVVLDILTPEPLNVEQLPEPFAVEKTGQVQYQGKDYSVARIAAKLAADQEWTDLRLAPVGT